MMIIEIDCAPSTLRPDHYYNLIIRELSSSSDDEITEWVSKVNNQEPSNKSFGEWTWQLEIDESIKSAVQSVFKKKIEEFYNTGCIRYGSW